ncbi:MAG TPA: hypothetical protein VM327_04245 [Candidatus Thermoplasmatota archaeon]|nr:hypothetical protein [Candidatus Thermoplasmatota archaeon]
MAFPGLLSAVPGPGAAGAPSRDAEAELAGSLAKLLLGRLDPEAMERLGPLADPLLDGRMPDRPGDLGRVLTLAGLGDAPRLDIPQPPAGPEPLLQALQGYADAIGEPATTAALRPAAAALRLSPEAEAALSQLVLAYTQALRLRAEATSDLRPEEQDLLWGDPQALADWQTRNPGAGSAELEADLLRVAARIDQDLLLQAADLLVRTVEAVRLPLALPPITLDVPLVGPTGALSFESADDPWQVARVLAAAGGTPPPSLAADASIGLDAALADLASLYGLPAGNLPRAAALPASLDHAVAGLVLAHSAGIRSGDGSAHARALLSAAKEAEPTLRTWSALLAASQAPQGPDVDAFLSAVVARTPSPTALAAAGLGAATPAAAPQPRPLEDLLAAEGMDPADALAAAASLPPAAAAALALLLEARAGLLAAHTDLLQGLDAAQRTAVLSTPDVAGLLARPSWSPSEAAQVEDWAQAVAAVPPGKAAALQQAQLTALQAAEAASLLLGSVQTDPLPLDAPGVPLTPAQSSTAADPFCPVSDFSDCDEDVFINLTVAGGILVTGRGQTRIDGRFGGGAPRIVIDLGGDDEYRVPVGTADGGLGVPYGIEGPSAQPVDRLLANAQSRLFGVALDVAGNDRYWSDATLAQGAASGLGAVGILADLGGDDRYEQAPLRNSVGSPRHAQGAGIHGGLGALIDLAGDDEYLASEGLAQGVARVPVFEFRDQPAGLRASPAYVGRNVTAVGLLLDLGAGTDSFKAPGGQGHAVGFGTVALLLDDQGATSYLTSEPSLAYQGGRGPASDPTRLDAAGALAGNGIRPFLQYDAGGLAALVDLGGPGDTYSSPDFPSTGLYSPSGWLVHARPDQQPRKQDDLLWTDLSRAVAFGLDSGRGDSDGDGVPDLVELVALSDPQDLGSTPGTSAGTIGQEVVDALRGLVAEAGDSDGDGFPDLVETQAGSDPHDPGSVPVSPGGGPGLLFQDPLLCPGEDNTNCSGTEGVCQEDDPACVALLAIGAPGPTTYTRRAILQVDLGGDDHYLAPVAWPGLVWVNDQVRTFGSTSLDIDGNDQYDTPDLGETQASVHNGTSLLLDLAGNDTYVAQDRAQGSLGGTAGAYGSVAMLVDFAGDDRYEAGPQSQGAAASELPAASGNRAAVAVLLDVAGNDRYRFAAQGSVQAQGGIGLAIDGTGSDKYESVFLPADPAGPTDAAAATLFETQGRIEVTANANVSLFATGLFADLGAEQDSYWTLTPSGTIVDVSATKDGAGIVANPVRVRGTPGGSVQGPVYASATFLDGPHTLLGDRDGDGAPNVAEMLAGTDPDDQGDVPVLPDGALVRLRPDVSAAGTLLGGKPILLLPGLAIGDRTPTTYTEYAGFIVDLGGDDQYLARNIGGTARVLHAPVSVATTTPLPGSAALLLDVGGGSDTYHPAPCSVERRFDKSAATRVSHELTNQEGNGAFAASQAAVPPDNTDIAFCPSLGGAALGVALLADGGGINDFDSRSSVQVTGRAEELTLDIKAWGLTQGSALFSGVGILATWNATNRFHAQLDLEVIEEDAVPEPRADALGLAQGASWGYGTGILATFGSGGDTYASNVSASAARGALSGATARALAQGAAFGGVGILADEGGSNTFHAPGGFAQGFASAIPTEGSPPAADGRPFFGAVGILLSGEGDDAYLGGMASQASAGRHAVLQFLPAGQSDSHSLAALFDGGGNDQYVLSPPRSPKDALLVPCPQPLSGEDPATCALSQGAAANAGVALLADWAGDDVYDASRHTFVQGSALNDREPGPSLRPGTGQGLAGVVPSVEWTGPSSGATSAVLLDFGGNDVYRARHGAQGYGQAKKGIAFGALADASGRDAYFLNAKGQGFGEGPGQGLGLLVDSGGLDRYDYGGTKTGTRPANGNGWIWTGATGGRGIDDSNIESALAAYRSLDGPQPATVTLVIARYATRASPVPDGGFVVGDAFFHIDVTPVPGQAVRRVDVLADGALVGVARPSAAPPGASPRTESFLLPWPTDEGADGAYTLQAIAFLSPVQDGPSSVAAPDGATVESKARTVVVDNPPKVLNEPRLSRSAIAPAAAGDVNRTFLTLEVSRDAALPAGVAPATGRAPGANVTVSLRSPGSTVLFPVYKAYVYNGTTPEHRTTTIVLDGRCQASSRLPSCDDGRYLVNVSLQDGLHTVHLPEQALVIDNAAPTSDVTFNGYANREHRAGLAGLAVPVSVTDTQPGLGTDDVAGLGLPSGALYVVRLDGANERIEAKQVGVDAGATTLEGIVSGQTVHLLSVSIDALGNTESPCIGLDGAERPCYRAKAAAPANVRHVYVDFVQPTLEDVRLNRTTFRPGTPVRFSATASDVHSGLDRVFVRIEGASIDGAADPTIPLLEGPDGTFSAVRSFSADASGQAAFKFTMTAVDRAGNVRTQVGSGVVDAQAPMLTDIEVVYFDGTDRIPFAKPQSRAVVRLNAVDRAVDSLVANATSVGGPAEVACRNGAADEWTCDITVAANATDGTHAVPLRAVDAAGNVAYTTVAIVVKGAPPEITDPRIVAVGPDFIEVTWKTTSDATTEVAYGISDAELTRSYSLPGLKTLTTEHRIRIPDLAPSTRYYIRPSPRSPSNVANLTGEVLHDTTASALVLALPGFPEGASWGGLQTVDAMVMSLAGQDRATVTLRIEDAAQLSTPTDAAPAVLAAPGPLSFQFDTRRFPDGDYRLLLEAKRGKDRAESVSPVFRIDNTPPALSAISPAPGSTVAQDRPTLELAVTDPFGGPLPTVEGLSLAIDGVSLKPADARYDRTGPQPVLRVGLPLRLADGDHVATVGLADKAGNLETAAWAFRVDVAAPRLVGTPQVAYRPGAMPSESVFDVDLDVRDASGVASVRVGLAPGGGETVALLSKGPHWVGALRLPPGTPDGPLVLPVTATDTLGNTGPAGELHLVVDRTAPSFTTVSSEPSGLTSLVLRASTDEPSSLKALLNGTGVAEDPALAVEHFLRMGQLRPGRSYEVDLVATDAAGNARLHRVHATMPEDTEPPLAPASLVALSPDEGVVRLTWHAAKDNSGIDHYEVVRVVGADRTPLPTVPGNQTSVQDVGAPAGRAAWYEVSAVDLAGLRGPPRMASTHVLALPRLSEPAIEPRTGASDQPFDVVVLYRHAAGTPPERIELLYGNLTLPLSPRGGDCTEGCAYGAKVLLPALLTLRAKPVALLSVQTDGQVATLPVEAPLVTLGNGELGVRSGDDAQDVPAIHGVLALLVALALAGLRRRRRP